MHTTKPRGLYILATSALNLIYGQDQQQQLSDLVEFVAPPQTPATIQANPALLADVEVIFSGWGGPHLDADFLNAAPKLKAFFYGAGATGGMITPLAWERGITITSAASINAIPVAEYTVASIIFSLKNVLRFMRGIHEQGQFPSKENRPIPGTYRTTVGLVSMGAIGRAVWERLRMLEIDILVHDPFLSEEAAQEMDVRLVSLSELFERSDVVSIHTPWLPETEGLIQGKHIAAMKPNATLINTSRGAVINEPEMIEVLTTRPDLTALLDVTYPEPPVPGSPLYTLPNVFLTPHIAGSIGDECQRMGQFMVDEFRRFANNEPLLAAIRPEETKNTSHYISTTA